VAAAARNFKRRRFPAVCACKHYLKHPELYIYIRRINVAGWMNPQPRPAATAAGGSARTRLCLCF
jgi:hypothetical protein